MYLPNYLNSDNSEAILEIDNYQNYTTCLPFYNQNDNY